MSEWFKTSSYRMMIIDAIHGRLWIPIICMMIVLFHAGSSGVVATPMVPAMFVFGDSLVHSGNNYLISMSKATYMPYGDKLGLPYIPPYSDPYTIGTRIVNGVNYAAAAADILDETGQNYVYTTTHIICLFCKQCRFS
ncbi:GDSL esterase/lipase [Thalictrum thalictroides]|uniref:GDSL esterase/lipase n=1 Tax=Thalictrum thalictroides TaxID=46969 RepID=A0A7J6V2C7_THATH|nr:GDSL esterase/lipase [Thalictrum thalictroides]